MKVHLVPAHAELLRHEGVVWPDLASEQEHAAAIDALVSIARAAEGLDSEVATSVRRLEEGSYLITAPNAELATVMGERLAKDGFSIHRSGDMLTARRQLPATQSKSKTKPTSHVRADGPVTRAAKTKLKAGAGVVPVARGEASKLKASGDAEHVSDDPATLRLGAFHDPWAMNAMRRMYKVYVGAENFSHFLSFVRAIDNLILTHRELNGGKGQEEGDEASEENESYSEARTRREIAAADITVPENYLEIDAVDLASLELIIGGVCPADAVSVTKLSEEAAALASRTVTADSAATTAVIEAVAPSPSSTFVMINGVAHALTPLVTAKKP